MEALFRKSDMRLSYVPKTFRRYLYYDIHWEDKLIGIIGARGTGKTTLMLQHLLNRYGYAREALFVSLDDLYFSTNRVYDLAEQFFLNGGKALYIDEVHKYENWAVDIKNIYDILPGLSLIFSGSSAISIHKSGADLSRRAAIYRLSTLSLREYVSMQEGYELESYTLNDVLSKHEQIVPPLIQKHRPVHLYKQFLTNGSYPFFKEAKALHSERLLQTVNAVLENDIPMVDKLNWQSITKLRKLLVLIAESVPFKPNISELAVKTSLSRDFLLHLLHLLEKSGLIRQVRQAGSPTGLLTKPEKIYLANPALLFSLAQNRVPETGTLRETFFVEQVGNRYSIEIHHKADFLVDSKYVIEVGGKNKSHHQLAELKDAFLAKDDIETGYKNSVPLWLFGFMY